MRMKDRASDAAKALSVHRNSVGPWLRVLEERVFVSMTRGQCIGPSGVGIASTWALTELPTKDGKPATNAFKKFESPAQKPCIPVTNPVQPRLIHDADAQKL